VRHCGNSAALVCRGDAMSATAAAPGSMQGCDVAVSGSRALRRTALARRAGIDKVLGSATGEAHSGHAQLAKVVVWTSKMQHQAAGQMPLHTAVYIMVRAGVAGAEALLTTCWVLTRLDAAAGQ